MVLTQVTTGVASLDDHLLAGDGPAGEGQLVAGAAPSRFRLPVDADGGPAIADRVVDRPGALVAAHVGGPAVVAGARRRAVVVERLVALAARPDHLAAVRLGAPAARRLTAIPFLFRKDVVLAHF